MSANTITWTASAKQIAMLEKAAATMNAVSWCDKDNTAKTVFDNFFLPWMTQLLENPVDLMSNICDGIETGFESYTAEDKARVAELRKAFRAAFNIP